MASFPGSLRRWIRAPVLSPSWLFSRAGLILLCFGVVHLLGWRESVSFLSGPTSDGVPGLFSLVAGITYALVYFGAVVGAPILGIAAVLLAGMNCVARRINREA